MTVTFNLTGIGTVQSLSVPDGSTMTATATTSGGPPPPPPGPRPHGPNPASYVLTADWTFTGMSTLPIVNATGTIPDANHWKVYGGFGHAPYIDDRSPYWVTPGINTGNPFQLDPTVGLRMITKQEPNGSYSGAFLQGFDHIGWPPNPSDKGFHQRGGYWEASIMLPSQTEHSTWGAFWGYTAGNGQFYTEIDWEFGYDVPDGGFFYCTAGFFRWPLPSGSGIEQDKFVQQPKLATLSQGFHTFGWEIIVSTAVINFWLDGAIFVSYSAPPEMLTDFAIILDNTMNGYMNAGPHEFDIQYVRVWQHV